MLQYEGAPTKDQIGSNYCERRIRCVAVDPNNPNIVYAGGSSYTYQGDSSLYRSCDGGKTWKVVSINGTNSIVSTQNGDYGGVEPTCINVKPDTGELWASGNCTGLSKLTPPYLIKQNNNQENNTNNSSNQNTVNNENKNENSNMSNSNNVINNSTNNSISNEINNTTNSVITNTANNTVENKIENASDNKTNIENKVEEVLSKVLPFAGKKQTLVYLIFITVICAIISYFKYRKTN